MAACDASLMSQGKIALAEPMMRSTFMSSPGSGAMFHRLAVLTALTGELADATVADVAVPQD